jgi:hypothetical protein
VEKKKHGRSKTKMSLLTAADEEKQSTFMREAGMADTGDYMWQHAEKMKERVMEKHGQ